MLLNKILIDSLTQQNILSIRGVFSGKKPFRFETFTGVGEVTKNGSIANYGKQKNAMGIP